MLVAELMYKPFRRYPALFTDNFDKSWLHKDFIQISNVFNKPVKNYRDAIPDNLLTKEMDGVYSFNVFNEIFLQMFNEEINNFYEISEKVKNSCQKTQFNEQLWSDCE